MEPKPSIARDLTQTAVLALLGRAGPLSRADVARELDISPPTVTQVMKRLLEQGVVAELDQAPSRGGRRGQRVGLVGTAARAVGVKVAGEHLAIVDARIDGTIMASHTIPFDPIAPDPAGRLASALRPFLDEQSAVPLLGVGVGVPGVVDSPDSGQVQAPVLGWVDVPIGRHLRGAFGLPVLVENDVNAVAAAEQLFGRGRQHQDYLVVTIGRGIGLAIVTRRTLYRGAHGGAGEFGHFPADPDGPLCECGNRGCLEAIIGTAGLVTSAREAGLLRRTQGIERLQEMADRGNAQARAVYARAAELLARAVAALLTVLDPEVVIMLGEGTAAWRHWDEPFRETLRVASPPQVRQIPVEVETWDDAIWAQGAAALMLATPFDLAGFAGHQASQVLARFHGDIAG